MRARPRPPPWNSTARVPRRVRGGVAAPHADATSASGVAAWRVVMSRARSAGALPHVVVRKTTYSTVGKQRRNFIRRLRWAWRNENITASVRHDSESLIPSRCNSLSETTDPPPATDVSMHWIAASEVFPHQRLRCPAKQLLAALSMTQ